MKAKVLVGVSVGSLMGCFRAPPPWRKTAPLKRPIRRSMIYISREVSLVVDLRIHIMSLLFFRSHCFGQRSFLLAVCTSLLAVLLGSFFACNGRCHAKSACAEGLEVSCDVTFSGAFPRLKKPLNAPFLSVQKAPASYRAILGPSGPKSQKSQKRVKKESPGPSGPRGPKSPRRVKKGSKTSQKGSFLTRF